MPLYVFLLVRGVFVFSYFKLFILGLILKAKYLLFFHSRRPTWCHWGLQYTVTSQICVTEFVFMVPMTSDDVISGGVLDGVHFFKDFFFKNLVSKKI